MLLRTCSLTKLTIWHYCNTKTNSTSKCYILKEWQHRPVPISHLTSTKKVLATSDMDKQRPMC